MGTSALCDVGTHQPVTFLVCMHVPGNWVVILYCPPLKSCLLADFIKQYMSQLTTVFCNSMLGYVLGFVRHNQLQ